MSPVTHYLTGWVFANTAKLTPRDRALVTWACVAPDIDGLGIIPELLTRNSAHPLLWFSEYHHSWHTLLFSLIVAVVAFVLARERVKTAMLALISFHIHLIEDLLGSRGPDGYQWPIPYLKPFSPFHQWTWRGQWVLNGWQNIFLTMILLIITFWLAWLRGYSPIEMFSKRADTAFVSTIRSWIPKTN